MTEPPTLTTNLDGQHAIVTGAAAGIGRAVARALHAAGANVTVTDIDGDGASAVADSLSAVGPACMGLRLDVTDDASVRAGVAQAADRWSRVDILVNNAGVSGYSAPVWETTDADWQRVLDLNLTGTFRMCRAVVPHMRERGYGRIVNIASISAKDGNVNVAAYPTSKAGILGFTRALAMELADQGVLVNAVSPAAVDTENALASDPRRCALRSWPKSPWAAPQSPRKSRPWSPSWPRPPAPSAPAPISTSPAEEPISRRPRPLEADIAQTQVVDWQCCPPGARITDEVVLLRHGSADRDKTLPDSELNRAQSSRGNPAAGAGGLATVADSR